MKYFLQILGFSTLIIMIICLVSRAIEHDSIEKISLDKQIENCYSQLENAETRKTNAHKMAEAARALGYSDIHSIIMTAKLDWEKANDDIIKIKEKIKELEEEKNKKIQSQNLEYPIATEVWYFLDSKGINDYIKAGILGNMMAEAGGQTLRIQVNAYSPGFYGVCQWSLYYNPQLNNTDLNTQLNHLINSMPYEFNTFGKLYQKGFNYDAFLEITDVKEAALAFAKCYERCASGSYKVRKQNAEKAYKYYVG